MQARATLSAVLASRESSSLESTENQDLALVWQTVVAHIVEENPAFADLWYRKLERDPLDVEPSAIAA